MLCGNDALVQEQPLKKGLQVVAGDDATMQEGQDPGDLRRSSPAKAKIFVGQGQEFVQFKVPFRVVLFGFRLGFPPVRVTF